jgi:hypothetical protein
MPDKSVTSNEAVASDKAMTADKAVTAHAMTADKATASSAAHADKAAAKSPPTLLRNSETKLRCASLHAMTAQRGKAEKLREVIEVIKVALERA